MTSHEQHRPRDGILRQFQVTTDRTGCGLRPYRMEGPSTPVQAPNESCPDGKLAERGRSSHSRNGMDDGLESLYAWVDTVPLSRPKRTFTRDFADGGACWGWERGPMGQGGSSRPGLTRPGVSVPPPPDHSRSAGGGDRAPLPTAAGAAPQLQVKRSFFDHGRAPVRLDVRGARTQNGARPPA